MKLITVFIEFAIGISLVMGRPQSYENEENQLHFLYFPTPEEQIEIVFNDTQSLLSSNLKPATKTLLLLDGFTSFGYTAMNLETKDTFSGRNDTNVIIIDWSAYSGFGRPIEDDDDLMLIYIDVIFNQLPKAADDLADFIHFICENNGISFKDVVLIGHSLGSHTAGATGRATQVKFNQTIGKIIGEDPSLQFSVLEAPIRLRSGDADVVEVYITNRHGAGDKHLVIGDVDIFVNGGDNQPCLTKLHGLPSMSQLIPCQSHAFSFVFYNYLAGNSTLKGCPCKGAKCLCHDCEMDCGELGISLGPHIPAEARGSFHVNVGYLEWQR